MLENPVNVPDVAILSTTSSSCCYFPGTSYLLSTVMLDPIDIPVITWLQFPFHFHVFTITFSPFRDCGHIPQFKRVWKGKHLQGCFLKPSRKFDFEECFAYLFRLEIHFILVSSSYSTEVLIQILLQFCTLYFTSILDWGGHVRLWSPRLPWQPSCDRWLFAVALELSNPPQLQGIILFFYTLP